ncbi:MAG: AAA family ATPase [Desulfobacteraceae bacterium]|nr:AAA family ATPase [Desulfobacteraceae bacterium]
MISEIRLINYKKFLCERIPLEPITVFIGPNGAGKSTIASAYSIGEAWYSNMFEWGNPCYGDTA